MLIAGDVGDTKTDLAIYSIESGPHASLAQTEAHSANYTSLQAGTGLGESFLTWDGSHYVAHVSEGGYPDFAPTDEKQTRPLAYLLPRLGQVGVERVSSEIGVPNIYEFLRGEEVDAGANVLVLGPRFSAQVKLCVTPWRRCAR